MNFTVSGECKSYFVYRRLSQIGLVCDNSTISLVVAAPEILFSFDMGQSLYMVSRELN